MNHVFLKRRLLFSLFPLVFQILFVFLQSKTNMTMDHDISESIPQGGDRAQEKENRRIAAITDELRRLCRVYEAQSGAGNGNVDFMGDECSMTHHPLITLFFFW